MGSFVISVSIGTGCYRHIQIGASATQFRLHQAILKSFDFEDDHMHAFFMDHKRWSNCGRYVSSKSEPSDRLTKRYSLEKLELAKGKKFLYLFDFGDEWLFECKVLRELEEETDIPRVIRSVGAAPEQYPDYDDDWGDDPQDLIGTEIRVISNGKVQSRVLTEEDFPQPPESETEWPDYDYEGFPTLYPSAETFLALAKLTIPESVWMQLWDYFEAAARLYGVIPLRKLLEIYNKHNRAFSEEVFLEFAEILRHEYRLYSILNCDALKHHEPMASPLDWEIVAQYVYAHDISDYDLFTQLQGDTPYRILPKAEFLRYAELEYFPNSVQAKAMRTFLKTILDGDEDADGVLLTIQTLCETDMGLEDSLDILEEEGLRFASKKEFDTFLSLYQELDSHTRKPLRRGHTPEELERKMPLTGQMTLF